MQLGKPVVTPNRSSYLLLSMRENRNISGMKFSKYLFVSLSLHVRWQRRIFVLPQGIWMLPLLICLSHKNVGLHCALNIPYSLKAQAHCSCTLENSCKKDDTGKIWAKIREHFMVFYTFGKICLSWTLVLAMCKCWQICKKRSFVDQERHIPFYVN